MTYLYLVPLFQSESSFKTFGTKMNLLVGGKATVGGRGALSHEWSRTKTCLDTDAKDNSEMVYSDLTYQPSMPMS